ncbi:hypothetical protein BX666DRAFT_1881548 [Dichotomocladium elegans]|nr:hypothetical protein BX666DRAFT_1881548 [Dichotomocladium elegans]
MIQSLGVPVVSLSVPNIHKLNAITSDDLSCMWTVFTKCKDNLENGRRLENMSWRLWYRETLIEKTQDQHVRTPIPIQQQPSVSAPEEDYFSYASSASSASTCSNIQTPPSLKHVSPSSFKRMISSLNTPIDHHALTLPVSQPSALAASVPPCPTTAQVSPTISVTADPPTATVTVVDAAPEKLGMAAPEPPAKTPTTFLAAPKPIAARSSKFFLSDDEESDNDDSFTNACDNDDGFWSTVRSEIDCARQKPSRSVHHGNNSIETTGDFAKRALTPAPLSCRRSLLTSMLNANPTNPMARPRRIGHRKRPSNSAELSQSLRYCVDWEQQQNAFFDEFMAPPIKVKEPSFQANDHWENFQGW